MNRESDVHVGKRWTGPALFPRFAFAIQGASMANLNLQHV